MTWKEESTPVLVAVMVTLAAIGCFMFVVVAERLRGLQAEVSAANTVPVDVSGWGIYENNTYGFELEYPPQWTLSIAGLANDVPFVSFGNPLGGMATYVLRVSIENNSSSLSSGNYVHDMLANDRVQDALNAKNGPAPTVTPSFDKLYVLTVGGYPAYELYNVFEFDHQGEQVYVAHGQNVLKFDFPTASENPNLSLPVANNGVAHEIMNTLVFTQQ